MAERLSTVVIGSGFGGSVVAHRLTAAGEKVTLLERGPWRDTEPMRRAGVPGRRPLPAGRHFYSHLLYRFSAPWLAPRGARADGLFDIHYDPSMSLIASSGVGGGSHVYSAMNTRPARWDYWDGHAPGVSAAGMDPHYDWMLQVMGARPPASGKNIPCYVGDDLRDHPHLTTEGVAQPAMGFDFAGAAYRDNSYFGSHTGEKRTLDDLLLVPAREQGLDIRAGREVRGIAANGETPFRFRLQVKNHPEDRIEYLLAERVVLAAGTLNTLKLLFSSCERGALGPMPALGHGFSGNGDQVALWWTHDGDLSVGPPTHGRFALRDEPDSPMVTRFGFNGIDAIPMPGPLRRKLKRQAILVSMGEDGANGRLGWRRGRLRVHYERDANPVLGRIDRMLTEMGRRTGTRVQFLRRRPFTVHPLGGARLGASPEEGVVDACGQVFGHAGLYISDASALPAAPGTPPSMTISAWAAHVSEQIKSNNTTDQSRRQAK